MVKTMAANVEVMMQHKIDAIKVINVFKIIFSWFFIIFHIAFGDKINIVGIVLIQLMMK